MFVHEIKNIQISSQPHIQTETCYYFRMSFFLLIYSWWYPPWMLFSLCFNLFEIYIHSFSLGVCLLFGFQTEKSVSGQFCVPWKNLKVVWFFITGRMWGCFTLLAKYTKAVLERIYSLLWTCCLWPRSNKCIRKWVAMVCLNITKYQACSVLTLCKSLSHSPCITILNKQLTSDCRTSYWRVTYLYSLYSPSPQHTISTHYPAVV